MEERLKWILAVLQKMNANLWVRGEGQAEFAGAVNELTDVIKTYTAPPVPPVPIINQVFAPGELDALVDGIKAAIEQGTLREGIAAAVQATQQFIDIPALLASVQVQIEQSDVAVMSAITQSQGEVITALAPAPAPAP